MKYREVSHAVTEWTVPKPDVPPPPHFVTTQEGVPVTYGEDSLPMCAVRVVHPTNENAPSTNHSMVMVYLPPHAGMDRHSHETEETYVILEGTGRFLYHEGEREVGPGDFAYMPPWCVHGLENNGREVMVVLLATSPPNP